METTPATRPNDQRPQQAARCQGSRAKPTTLHPGGTAADGFLRHRFTPMYEEANGLPEDKGISKGVLNSLAILSGEYGLNLTDVSDKPYPYNLLLAYREAEMQLTEKNE